MRANTEAIKETVKMIDIMELYGLQPKRNKYVCPFHKENTPSLSIKGGMYNCFGCGAHGSIFDFVMQYEGCEFGTAKDLICERFGIENDNNITEAERKRFDEQNKQRKAAKEEKQRIKAIGEYAYRRLCDYLHWLQGQEPPSSPDSEYSKGFVERCHMLDYIECLIDDYMFDNERLAHEMPDVDSWIKKARRKFL